MKRIYKNNDLIFNLTINNFPINIGLIERIEFRFYTINPSNCVVKNYNDINEYNQVILQWDELKILEEGVLHYDYTVSLKNDEMGDGTQDTVNKVMTNYYIVSDGNININTDMANYYTKDEVDDLLANVEGGEVDLTKYYTKSQIDIKLNGYVEDDVLGSYYTKSEVNELIDNIDIPTGNTNVDLSDYYNKSEVNAMIPTDYIKSIPSEYITETELNAKGYLTQHQSLEGYAKLTDIPKEVYYLNYGVVGSTDFNDMSNAISKGYIINVYNIPNMEFINNTVFDVMSKTNTYIDLVATRCCNGATNGSKTDVNITTITITLKSDNTRTYKINSPQLKRIGGGTKFLADNGNYVEIDTSKFITEIPSEYVTETQLINKGYITTQYDDTSIVNRISALESEISGVTQQINELNGMIV